MMIPAGCTTVHQTLLASYLDRNVYLLGAKNHHDLVIICRGVGSV